MIVINFICWYNKQSSAYRAQCEDTLLGKSFIHIKNNKGPKTVSWVMPLITLTKLNAQPLHAMTMSI